MSTAADRALECVQNLYAMQVKLLDLLQGDLSDDKVRRDVRAAMREFEVLLQKADWRYMGGEDVLESLKMLPVEVGQALKIGKK